MKEPVNIFRTFDCPSKIAKGGLEPPTLALCKRLSITTVPNVPAVAATTESKQPQLTVKGALLLYVAELVAIRPLNAQYVGFFCRPFGSSLGNGWVKAIADYSGQEASIRQYLSPFYGNQT